MIWIPVFKYIVLKKAYFCDAFKHSSALRYVSSLYINTGVGDEEQMVKGSVRTQ